MAGRERLSRQELIRRQRRDGFVGRRSELAAFRENLGLPPEQAQFLFHIRGQAGVGKSTLVGQLAGVAREQGAVTAVVDESTASVVEAMEAVAAQLGRQGLTLKGVEKQLAAYRQRRHEAEAGGAVGPGGTGAAGATGATGATGTTGALGGVTGSAEPPVPSGQLGQSAQRGPAGAAQEANPGSPAVPSGAPAPATAPPPTSPSTSSVIASQVGLAGLGMVPGLGAFAGAVDPHQVAVGADRLRAMLSARFRNQDDVQLVLSPLHVLTPVLLEDLHEAAQRRPWITLFFDTYERTGPVLDVWLRDVLFTERYGCLPANVLVVLAGQNRLDTRCWGDHLEFVTDLPLEVFTESEARQLLSDKGVSDERTAQVILRLSGRLPVLLSTLAESRPAGAEDVGDPSGTAVERFLKWESDPARRAAALACALPQELDEDVYRAAAGGYAAQGFGWLRTLPFVNDRGGRCTYHDVVRTAMLRLQRTASPRGWQEQHGRLAEAFRTWRLQLQDGDPDRAPTSWWDEARWREYRLQETYHLLCADERTALPGALRELLDAYDHGIGTLRRWVRTLARAGDDTTAAGLDGLDGHGLVGTDGAEPHSGSEPAGWGRRLSAALEAEDGAGIAVLTLLLTRGGLDEPDRARALTLRALDHHAADSHERALADFDAALALTPDDVEALHGRGRTYLATHRDDEALADFDRVLVLDPDDPRALAARGVTLSIAGRHEEALTALDRAVDAVPDDSWTITARAATYLALERHPEALADGDRAVALDPEYALAFGRRGAIHWAMGHREEALADFSSAIGLHPEYIWALGERGEANRLMGRHREALADFSRAVELDPEYDWALASRGQTHRTMGNYPEALADFDRALAIDPAYAWALSERGEVNRLMGRHREALTDFDRALELAPDDAWALASRGQTHRSMDNYPDALADFDRALELAPEYGWALSERGEIHRHLGHHEEALADFDHALELEPGNAPDTVNRALTYAVTGRHDEAAAGFDRALEILTTEEPATDWDALRAKATAFAVHCVREHWDRAAETFEDFIAGAPDAALRRDTATELEMLTDVLPSLTERITPYRRRLTEQP